MRIELETENKTIQLLEPIGLDVFFKQLKETFKNDSWKDYDLIPYDDGLLFEDEDTMLDQLEQWNRMIEDEKRKLNGNQN